MSYIRHAVQLLGLAPVKPLTEAMRAGCDDKRKPLNDDVIVDRLAE